jgi:ubiquinone/menaquinone biosynthesis C-methylase UbiE
MLITDYSRIAARYDDSALRHDIPADEDLGRLLAERGGKLSVLDLACGTGNYLVRQVAAYPGSGIEWTGVDKSEEMLARARTKGLPARLLRGDAADLPLDDASVDYVKIRFAFHHFVDKERAAGEVLRVLRPGGALSIHHLAHDYMRRFWTQEFFPSIEAIDRERFMSTFDIHRLLSRLGFAVSARIETFVKGYDYPLMISETLNRDMSQLNLISDEEYEAGLARLRKEEPDGKPLLGDISFLHLLAEKRG